MLLEESRGRKRELPPDCIILFCNLFQRIKPAGDGLKLFGQKVTASDLSAGRLSNQRKIRVPAV